MQTPHFDLAIIGAGTAGMSAYEAASRYLQRIAVIDPGPYGTLCARSGCMPSKLLVTAANAAHDARRAGLFGVQTGDVWIDTAAVMRRVRDERDRFVQHTAQTVDHWPRCTLIKGRARFTGSHRLMVDDRPVTADRFIVATGAQAQVPQDWREKLGERVITSDEVFEWPALPHSVAVVGAGSIGLELAQALHRLGVRVRVYDRGRTLGPLTDPVVQAEAVRLLGAELDLRLGAEILEVSRTADGVRVRAAVEGQVEDFEADCLLAAMGRKPVLQGLGLEQAGVAFDADGHPPLDPQTMRLGDGGIFVAGDASGWRPLLHEAALGGRIAGENAAHYPDVVAYPRKAALNIVFCEPQMALAGQTHADLLKRLDAVAIGASSWSDQGRARVMAQLGGVLRVYAERSSHVFLGAEMIGPRAEHLGHLLAWSAQHKLTVRQMLDCPVYHPVLEEGLRPALVELARELGAYR